MKPVSLAAQLAAETELARLKMALAQTACCVIAITVTAMRVRYRHWQENSAMASIHTYEGWWDLSPIDGRNERPLLSAFVAVIAAWGTTFLFALF
jgi:hypothetical protein